MTRIHEKIEYVTGENRRATVKKAREKLFNKQFPVPKEIVYVIQDENKKVIYVGETVNGPRRLAEHFGYDKSKAFHKGQFKKAYCKKFWSYDYVETTTKEERLIKEIELEFEYQPIYNKRWQTK
jgi:excinuclease UvrABC nuclease subunit